MALSDTSCNKVVINYKVLTLATKKKMRKRKAEKQRCLNVGADNKITKTGRYDHG
jgi:hypothetical protein